MIRIQSKDGKQTITVLPIRTGAANPVNQTKLTFRLSGNDYQLSQVWLADGVGRQLRRQRTNSDVSQNVGIVDIVAGN
jgi:hypothetical protein